MPWFRRLASGFSPRRSGFAPRPTNGELTGRRGNWTKFFSEYFGFPLLSPHQSFTLLFYSSRTDAL
jgi:hypothetical protein